MATPFAFPELTAEEAAALIPHGALVAFSGFTPAGAAKAVPRALAVRAESCTRPETRSRFESSPALPPARASTTPWQKPKPFPGEPLTSLRDRSANSSIKKKSSLPTSTSPTSLNS